MSEFFLRSNRLQLRQWKLDDEALAWELWGNPEVTKLISKEPLSRNQVMNRLQREIDQANESNIQYWPVFTHGGDFVGCCGLRPYGADNAAAEVGFHLVPRHWGQGLATEAAGAVIEYAFQTLDMKVLFAGHHPQNKSSRNALQKLGFVGTSAEFYEPTGLHHPSYLLYRDEAEFSIRRAKPEDAFALAIVHHESIKTTFNDLIKVYANSRTLDDFERLWQARFDDSSCITSVLLRGEQIVGLVSATVTRDDDADGTFGEVGRIYLHPCAWQKGHGADLLKTCEADLVRMGFQTSKLWVFEPNKRAIRFYERNGYRPDGKTKADFETRLLRYEKSLL